MKKWKKIFVLILSFCMLFTAISFNGVTNVQASSTYSRINVLGNESGKYDLAQAQFIAKGQNVELVYNNTSMTGDIVVEVNEESNTYGLEGYGIVVDDNIVTVHASTNNGAFYGLQNVLQQLEKGSVSSVDNTQPYKQTRALFVDTARKYFGVSWFESIMREMSWNGLNTLYISFSNDEGFRLLLDDMSLSFDDGNGNTVSYDHEFMSHLVDNPETVSDSAFLTERNANATDEGSSRVVTNYDNNKYYTQDDMERILAYAKAYGITVIPELNSPGHFGQIMWYFPEYRIQGTWYEDGQPHYGLDLTNPEAFNFGQALVKKYIDYFADKGLTSFCVGGEEYSAGSAENTRIASYTNSLVEYAESKGMTAYAWNDGQAAANSLLKDSAIVNAWNGTSDYNLINFDSSYLYYVLKGREWKPNAQTLFEEWNPNQYADGTILNTMQGASLAIWCDVPNKETPSFVLESIIPSIQSFGYKMWNYSETSTASLTDEYLSYSEFASSVTSAPVVSSKTALATVGYVIEESVDVTSLPEPLTGGTGYELVTFNTTTNTINDGTYIIVNDTNKAMTKAMTQNVSGTAGLDKATVTISDNIATPVDTVYEWTFVKQSDGTYYITDSDGAYLNISSFNVTTSTKPQKITATISNGKVQLSNGEYAINYYATNGQIFSWWYVGTNDSNNMQTLYKKLSGGLRTVDLYNLIIEATAINNDDNRYGSEEYETLLNVLVESEAVYRSAYVTGTTITQDELNAQTKALQAAIDALKLSDTTLNYIEIPVEILDFRADGVMFEYVQNTEGKGLYELLTDTKFGNLTYENDKVDMPGVSGDRKTNDEWNGWNDTCKRLGLVEDYLVNGAPVYKEATVDYVAKLIAKGYFGDLSGSVTNWNDTISTTISTLYAGYDELSDSNSNLGTWEDTLTKTSTQANGGNMVWNDISTCYDLAYYILNNMWRSTEESDGEDTYNKKVGERSILRMLAGDDGYYYLDSTKEISYVDNYIYNTDLTTENTAETKFTPINNLGYESSNDYGDTTDTTSGVNFHYTLHANGSFVYNADDNLYFYFDGDDDVYFYIDGQLVMDLGGAHSHCDDEIYLNDIADELGLVEGGIYTFDMFYAERHTTQANLEFKTNIKIMDTMSTTSKGQYIASTQESIPYGSIIDEGTTVAYSFNLLNLRSVNVTDISFIDESLGSNLSKNSITLFDSSKTNGATTDISDIVVYYHTYDRPAPSESGVLNDDALETKTIAEITSMINAANENNYSSLEQGSYAVSISNEEELKSLLALGVPIDTQICVYGVKRTVTENDRPYINTVTSRAYYTSNGKKVALNGVASQKLTVLKSFTNTADKEQIVIDYGKAVQIALTDITDNIYLNENVTATFYGITSVGSHNQIRTNVGNIFTSTSEGYSSASSTGTYFIKDGAIEFKLNQMLSKVEKVYAVYEIKDASLTDTSYETYYLLTEIDIMPATMMYYETDFAEGVFTTVKDTSSDTTEIWSTITDNVTADALQNEGTIGMNQTYGFDSSYENDSLLSNSTSYHVNGAGRTKTIATFSFTGTGFDLISRTGADQGSIRVDVYSDAAMTNRVKAMSVLNKSESGLELYQIPVISLNTLKYGTYYVKIGVNAAYTDETYPELSRGNEFYFDAVRIYNPINVEATNDDALSVKEAYMIDGEYAPDITEVRSMLLDATTYESSVGSDEDTDGVLFVDKVYNTTTEGVTVGTYSAIGPNNEVYLTPGQAIAFKINAIGNVASVDIGAKSADGNTVVLNASISNGTDKTQVLEKEIATSTSLFYDVMGDTNEHVSTYFNADGYAYVVITNTGTAGSILSITDIKVAYSDLPTTTTFTVDNTVLTYASLRMSELQEPEYDVISAEFSSSTCRILRKTEMTVVTTAEVETLKITNKFGFNVYAQTSYTVNDDGNKVWTVKIIPVIFGNNTFTVTGYGADGTSGESATASIRVKLF